MSKNKIIKSIIKVGVGNILTLLASFGSQVLIAWAFGAGKDMDAYLTASVIPTYIQAVLISGLNFVLIPSFVDLCEKREEDKAWSLVGTTITIVFFVLSCITVLCTFFSDKLINLYAPELALDKAALASQMLTIIILSAPIVGIGSLTTGVQNARGSFLFPALAPAIGAICNLFCVLFFYKTYGAITLAYGNLTSMVVQGLITAIPVLTHKWKSYLRISDPIIVDLLTKTAPFIAFGLLTRITPIFERYFASGLPDGDLSYLGYATKISSIVQVVISSPIASVMFPEIARSYSKEGVFGLERTIIKTLKYSLVIGLPIVALLSMNSLPMVKVLFERGEFTEKASIMTSLIIPFALIATIMVMIGNVINRTFYVLGNTFFVTASAAISSVMYFLGLFLTEQLSTVTFVVLAAAQAIQWVLLEVWLIYVLTKKRVLNFHLFYASIKNTVLFTLIASSASALAGRLFESPSQLLEFIIPTSFGCILYILLITIFDEETNSELLKIFPITKVIQKLTPWRRYE